MKVPSSLTKAWVMMEPSAEFASVNFSFPVMKSQTPEIKEVFHHNAVVIYALPIQLLVTTTAIPAVVEMLMESIVSPCLSILRSFSKMWSRFQIFILLSMDDVMTALSLPTTSDLISTIL